MRSSLRMGGSRFSRESRRRKWNSSRCLTASHCLAGGSRGSFEQETGRAEFEKLFRAHDQGLGRLVRVIVGPHAASRGADIVWCNPIPSGQGGAASEARLRE